MFNSQQPKPNFQIVCEVIVLEKSNHMDEHSRAIATLQATIPVPVATLKANIAARFRMESAGPQN